MSVIKPNIPSFLKTCFFIFISWVALAGSYAQSASRHALVIGNSDYSSGFNLATPYNDATEVAKKLAGIGYTVHNGQALLNLNLQSFNEEIDGFLSSIQDGSSTLIYYAGHGAASNGSNYLIPILPQGVTLRSDADIRERSISLQGILERVETQNPSGVNVFFFDACRDAPVDNVTRSINMTGLASLDPGRQPRGSFVGFSTEYGKLALDGDDPSGHSPFASAILSSLDETASAPIELFYKGVTEKVYDNTSGQQFPIQESKIRGQHCIVECAVIRNNTSIQEFGTLTVVTKPIEAVSCYLIDAWDTPLCGKQIVLPVDEPVEVTVTAKGFDDYKITTELNSERKQLSVLLERTDNITLKIIGGIAAAALVGALISSQSDSGSGGSETYNVNLVRP